jgi:hypothetical protein
LGTAAAPRTATAACRRKRSGDAVQDAYSGSDADLDDEPMLALRTRRVLDAPLRAQLRDIVAPLLVGVTELGVAVELA